MIFLTSRSKNESKAVAPAPNKAAIPIDLRPAPIPDAAAPIPAPVIFDPVSVWDDVASVAASLCANVSCFACSAASLCANASCFACSNCSFCKASCSPIAPLCVEIVLKIS